MRFTGGGPRLSAGWAVAGGSDVNGDGLDDVVTGGWNAPTVNYGIAYLLHGAPSGDLTGADAAAVLSPNIYGAFAYALDLPGDIDADGVPDILVGAPWQYDGATSTGAVYLFPGTVSGTVTAADATAMLLGNAHEDNAGVSVAGAGDVDGDGQVDLVVGANHADDAGAGAGVVYLLLGPVTGDGLLADAELALTGEAASDGAGSRVARAGDTDGDGLAELLVSATDAGIGGAVYVVGWAGAGTASLADADARVDAEDTNDGLYQAAPLGDVDADGYDDVLLGATLGGTPNDGTAYVFHGPLAGSIAASAADALIRGNASATGVGSAVAGPGDLDGDGLPDLLVAGSEGTCIWLSPVTGTVDASTADGLIEDAEDAIAGAGDVDGDGVRDLVLGSTGPGSGRIPYTAAGLTYLLYGRY